MSDDFIINELERIRREKRITRRDLAKSLGVNENTLACWESLQNDPRHTQVMQWAKALGYELDLHYIGRALRAAE